MLTDRKLLVLLLAVLRHFLNRLVNLENFNIWRSTQYMTWNNIPINNLTNKIVHNIPPWRRFRAKHVGSSTVLLIHISFPLYTIYYINIYTYIFMYMYKYHIINTTQQHIKYVYLCLKTYVTWIYIKYTSYILNIYIYKSKILKRFP